MRLLLPILSLLVFIAMPAQAQDKEMRPSDEFGTMFSHKAAAGFGEDTGVDPMIAAAEQLNEIIPAAGGSLIIDMVDENGESTPALNREATPTDSVADQYIGP